jgi:lipopolysaccharide transport system ATP-binding protein
MRPIIRVEGLGKRYWIGAREAPYQTLRDALAGAVRAPLQLLRRNGRRTAEAIWALQDVSFEVLPGEVVGIIGRNGAGKSTLLKILSRITEPTTGWADLYGRVGSLLEVGTGFHPELTGRENIYLNGVILGMKRREVEHKFDEIVAFAEVDKFIDTPVKHYSSGMYLRLAFAVAAHLDPEILIVDEVLAVGDVAFQKKCLGKMGDVARQGRTVLFVSHNMGAVLQLCPSSLLIQQGRLIAMGPSRGIIETYLARLSASENGVNLAESQDRSGTGRLRFVDVSLRDAVGRRTTLPIAGHPLTIVLHFRSYEELAHVGFGLTILNQSGIAVTHCNVDACGPRFRVPPGEGEVVCTLAKLPLPLGRYRISALAYDDHGELDLVGTACVFDVEAGDFYPTSYLPPIQVSAALVEHSWQVTCNGNLTSESG